MTSIAEETEPPRPLRRRSRKAKGHTSASVANVAPKKGKGGQEGDRRQEVPKGAKKGTGARTGATPTILSKRSRTRRLPPRNFAEGHGLAGTSLRGSSSGTLARKWAGRRNR